jgi:hypothetical protein
VDGSSQRSPAFAEFGLLVVLLEILIEALHIFMIHANRAALLLSDAHYIHSLDQTNVHIHHAVSIAGSPIPNTLLFSMVLVGRLAHAVGRHNWIAGK